jgi:hypothetical protein
MTYQIGGLPTAGFGAPIPTVRSADANSNSNSAQSGGSVNVADREQQNRDDRPIAQLQASSEKTDAAKKAAKDSEKWKQEAKTNLEVMKELRAAFKRYGPKAKSAEELRRDVKAKVESQCDCTIGVAGSTDRHAHVDVSDKIENPYLRDATVAHEAVHKQWVQMGIATYGQDTPELNKWFTNPQNQAQTEVEAYSAGISSLENSLRNLDAH